MAPYLIVFLIVIFSTYRAEKLYKRGYKYRGTIYIIISILFMSILAAIRNDDIGKDIETYVIPTFNWALKYNFSEFMKIGNLESGYMIFSFIITNVFKDYHFILFFIQIIISLLIYSFAYKERNRMPMWLVMTVFLLIIYNDTFTMMRQSIAVLLIILSYTSLKEKKYLKTILLYVIAILFHNTAMISILGYIFIVINYSNKITKNSKIYINIGVLVIYIICLSFYQKILYFFTFNVSLLPIRFYEYFNTEYYLDVLSISKSVLLFKIICIFISIVYNNIFKKEEKESKLIMIFLLIDLGIYILSFKLGPIMRLGYYFSYPALLYLLPQSAKIFKKDKFNRIFSYITIIIFLFCFWFFNNIIHNESGNTYPYKSDIVINLLK